MITLTKPNDPNQLYQTIQGLRTLTSIFQSLPFLFLKQYKLNKPFMDNWLELLFVPTIVNSPKTRLKRVFSPTLYKTCIYTRNMHFLDIFKGRISHGNGELLCFGYILNILYSPTEHSKNIR